MMWWRARAGCFKMCRRRSPGRARSSGSPAISTAALVAILLGGLPLRSYAQTETPAPESSGVGTSAARRLVLVGLEFGAIDVNLPHPERPGESFGSQFRLGLQARYEITSWLGIDAEVGFSFLGESDSLNAILEGQGREPGAAYTLVDCGIGVVARWPLGSGRWAPFLRASGGLASLALSSPDGGTRETDPSWSAGGGVEWTVARPVVLRFQGRWLGQRTDDGITRSHATAELAVFYAFYAGSFE